MQGWYKDKDACLAQNILALIFTFSFPKFLAWSTATHRFSFKSVDSFQNIHLKLPSLQFSHQVCHSKWCTGTMIHQPDSVNKLSTALYLIALALSAGTEQMSLPVRHPWDAYTLAAYWPFSACDPSLVFCCFHGLTKMAPLSFLKIMTPLL